MLYRVGGRMPLHATGVGLVLLAHAPPQVQEDVLAGDLTLSQRTPGDAQRRCAVRLADDPPRRGSPSRPGNGRSR